MIKNCGSKYLFFNRNNIKKDVKKNVVSRYELKWYRSIGL